MASFGFYLKAGVCLLLVVFVQDVLDAVLTPMLNYGCDPARTTVVEGAKNCLYIQQMSTWFIAVVIVGLFVTALARGAVLGDGV